MGRIGALRKALGFCITNPGPAGWIRARTQIRAPQDRSGPRGTDQGPAGRIRAPHDVPGPGSAERIRAPQYESGPRGTDQDSERRIRARRTNQGPRDGPGPRRTYRAPYDVPGSLWRTGLLMTNSAPQDELGPHVTNQGSPGRSGGPTPHIFFVSECAPPPPPPRK